jgi:diguanylate cyclase
MTVTISSGFASAISLLVLYKDRRRLWGQKYDKTQICLVIGICLWFVAELIYSYYQIWLNTETPFPSAADSIYMAGYVFFTYYLFSTLKILSQEIEREVLILISFAVAVSLGYIMNLSFGAAELISVEHAILALAVSVSYPILDGLLLVPAIVLLWSIRKGESSQTHWVMISIFIVLNAVGDIGFGYSVYIGTLARQVWIWDILYAAGYITIIAGLLWKNKYYSHDTSNYYNNTNYIGVSRENNGENMH